MRIGKPFVLEVPVTARTRLAHPFLWLSGLFGRWGMQVGGIPLPRVEDGTAIPLAACQHELVENRLRMNLTQSNHFNWSLRKAFGRLMQEYVRSGRLYMRGSVQAMREKARPCPQVLKQQPHSCCRKVLAIRKDMDLLLDERFEKSIGKELAARKISVEPEPPKPLY